MTPLEILNALGAIASLVSSANVVLKSVSRDEILLDRAEANGERLADNAILRDVVATAVADPVVEAIAERIVDRKNRAAHKIRSGGSVSDETGEMIADICDFLTAIKAQRGGVLGAEEFDKMWADYGCENKIGV